MKSTAVPLALGLGLAESEADVSVALGVWVGSDELPEEQPDSKAAAVRPAAVSKRADLWVPKRMARSLPPILAYPKGAHRRR